MSDIIYQQTLPLIKLQIEEQQLSVVSNLLMLHCTLAEDKTVVSETLTKFVDARALACPQPLLKIKIALRSVDNNDCLYMVATDPNSTHDVLAFTQQKNFVTWSWEKDEIFHFLIKNSK